MITDLGQWTLSVVNRFVSLIAIITGAFRSLSSLLLSGRRPLVLVFFKQVYFTGFESLKVIVIISLAIGTVLITQIISLVGAGNEALIGRVLVWVVIRELGPILTAIIVVARSGTAIATELGFMKINREVEYIEALGIPAEQYLLMPRIFGVATAVIILTIYFEIFSILGGFVVASLGWHVSFENFSQGILSSLTILDLSLSVVKSLCFGLFVTAACCMHGFEVANSTTQVPQAATKGVMMSLFLIFILDGVITFASLAFRNG